MAPVTVFPLLTARALARPFTYDAPDGVGKGAVVEIRFGSGKARGVVVETGTEPPPGVELAPVVRVAEQLPQALVDLALWLADYYGSTPGRALGARRSVRSASGGRSCPSLPTGTRWAARPGPQS